jgi:SAM-dependent methyltransferase
VVGRLCGDVDGDRDDVIQADGAEVCGCYLIQRRFTRRRITPGSLHEPHNFSFDARMNMTIDSSTVARECAAPASLAPPARAAGLVERSSAARTVPDELIHRSGDPSRPSLENRVAYQWEGRGDIVGFRHGMIRDTTILDYIRSGIDLSQSRRQAVLDVGCGYGNHLLMLNSMLDKPAKLRLVGVNLDPNQLSYARSFAAATQGYENCEFAHADLGAGLPFADGEFDVVSLSDVLEHMTDPGAALAELARITRPGGLIILSTPLKGSIFKAAARLANTLAGGRLYRSYYRGKNNTELDAAGNPIMKVHAGNDHVSEMSYRQLRRLIASVGLEVRGQRLMQVMSGSRWFDRHPFLLSGLMFLEGLHGFLRRPSWAHSVTFKLGVPRVGDRADVV